MNSKLRFSIIFALLSIMGFGQEISFEQHIVADDFTDGYDVFPYDLNNDGFMDILAAGKANGGQVAFWLNDGIGNFDQTPLKQGFSGARSVRAGNLNNDEIPDIVSAAWMANDIIYFEGLDNGEYTEHIVDNDFKGAHTVDLKDVNGDGALDILCSGFDYYGHNGEIAWWENDGQDSITWTKHPISDRFQQSPFIYGEDMDNDGDLDVIACGELNNEILWWENDGSGTFIGEYMVDSAFQSAHTVLARDIDQDNDMDILAAGCINSKLAWYENDGNQYFIKHNLVANGGDLWLDAADLDLDGDVDLVGAGMSASYIRWYKNDGNQQFARFNAGDQFPSGFAVIPVNMDGDGDIDLLAIGYSSDRISWFENNADSTTSVKEWHGDRQMDIRIYPNPCYDHINIDTDFTGLKKVTIVSISGNLLRTLWSPDRHTSIWLGNYSTGEYIVNIEDDRGHRKSFKFIKK